MRVLVAWGSRHGGTEGIARRIADAMREASVDVELRAAREVDTLDGYDAAILGGALYANRWHRDARRLITRHLAALRRIPVWLFSSGPLDESAARAPIAPVTEVAILMERIGAVGHATFGGRLEPDVTGWMAHAMAPSHSGDWRDPAQIRAWAIDIAARLSTARPRVPITPPARSLPRLVAHAVAGWSACAVVMAGLLAVASTAVAVAVHAIAAPLIFAVIARSYFGARGAREPLPVAVAFTAIVAGLDAAIVAGLIQHRFAMFASVGGTWLPLALIFAATWATGAIVATLPWPKPTPPAPTRPASAHP
ncbi:MAG TPA: flavodoxin domain-containing protein [Kofleriaceae bacterium]